jgi:hypothetical protein
MVGAQGTPVVRPPIGPCRTECSGKSLAAHSNMGILSNLASNVILWGTTDLVSILLL